ncbi:hypothetical protein FEP45_06091 [Burkholderia multivorans]|nr:hypothetical protein [Burkholderia multivorans]
MSDYRVAASIQSTFHALRLSFCRTRRDARRRRSDSRFGAEPRDFDDARTLVPAAVDLGRSIELHARGERPLVFLDQGSAGADALRDVPRPRAIRGVHAARRRPHRSARGRHDVRAARRGAAECRGRAAHRTGTALRGVSAAEGAARGRRAVRARAQAAAARAPARDRHRHVAAGRRAARRADHARASRAACPRDRVSGARAGRRRGGEARRGRANGERAARSRRAARLSRRRLDRRSVVVQRRSARARDCGE